LFEFMKLGLHFTQMAYGALDPMVLELIRTERLLCSREDRPVAEPRDRREPGPVESAEHVREAA